MFEREVKNKFDIGQNYWGAGIDTRNVLFTVKNSGLR